MIGRSSNVHDPVLGDLTRSRRLWRGSVSITDDVSVPLAIMGKRSAPDPVAVVLARSIQDGFRAWRPAIEAALEEHASTADAATSEKPLPYYAAVIAIDGHPTIELGYRVPWDDEHTLGAIIRDGQLVEINGSVLEP